MKGIIFHHLLKIYKIEKYFLKKLIWYHSNNFDNYLKYLEDLKKKLRNDTGEEDEQQIHQYFLEVHNQD